MYNSNLTSLGGLLQVEGRLEKGWFQGELWTSSPTQFEPFSDAA